MSSQGQRDENWRVIGSLPKREKDSQPRENPRQDDFAPQNEIPQQVSLVANEEMPGWEFDKYPLKRKSDKIDSCSLSPERYEKVRRQLNFDRPGRSSDQCELNETANPREPNRRGPQCGGSGSGNNNTPLHGTDNLQPTERPRQDDVWEYLRSLPQFPAPSHAAPCVKTESQHAAPKPLLRVKTTEEINASSIFLPLENQQMPSVSGSRPEHDEPSAEFWIFTDRPTSDIPDTLYLSASPDKLPSLRTQFGLDRNVPPTNFDIRHNTIILDKVLENPEMRRCEACRGLGLLPAPYPASATSASTSTATSASPRVLDRSRSLLRQETQMEYNQRAAQSPFNYPQYSQEAQGGGQHMGVMGGPQVAPQKRPRAITGVRAPVAPVLDRSRSLLRQETQMEYNQRAAQSPFNYPQYSQEAQGGGQHMGVMGGPQVAPQKRPRAITGVRAPVAPVLDRSRSLLRQETQMEYNQRAAQSPFNYPQYSQEAQGGGQHMGVMGGPQVAPQKRPRAITGVRAPGAPVLDRSRSLLRQATQMEYNQRAAQSPFNYPQYSQEVQGGGQHMGVMGGPQVAPRAITGVRAPGEFHSTPNQAQQSQPLRRSTRRIVKREMHSGSF